MRAVKLPRRVFIRIWQSRGGVESIARRTEKRTCTRAGLQPMSELHQERETRKKYEDRVLLNGMNFTDVASDSTALERELIGDAGSRY